MLNKCNSWCGELNLFDSVKDTLGEEEGDYFYFSLSAKVCLRLTFGCEKVLKHTSVIKPAVKNEAHSVLGVGLESLNDVEGLRGVQSL